MSKRIYNLRISCSNDIQKEKISCILGVKANRQMNGTWYFEVEEEEIDGYFDFIKYFIDILEEKYEQLKSIEISKEDISLWFLYGYENECNMEFLPSDLKRLGDNGISLCISCWVYNGSAIF